MISEFPLFVFTTCAGLAAGACVFSAAFPRKEAGKMPAWVFPLAMLVLLGVGLLGCMGHLHHPERFINALWNPMAGITQEAYFSILFGIALVIDAVVCAVKGRSLRALRIVEAVFGFLLACVMGLAYFNTLGVTAWACLPTIPMFVAGDLAVGAALWGLLERPATRKASFAYSVIVVELIFACALALLAVHFNGLGLSPLPFVVAIVLAPCAHIALAWATKANGLAWGPTLACACVLVGCIVARYAFYAAYAL
ncbi:DmsC/YnfH family molybdoenzyme membrane anchor subunit [Denitrobacterium detoxificans]|uniref:DmsC/YnfH family molybdoenzyme membrane anchor subunit n=1 Tax=Denitrobacterium detoxificans TaxID=79604 RepID=UPI0026ED9754|nr:DmsC/YnfH family molybdoenzyme membrane anchor subunit [Denitrobacterium detoxificans]